jgi:hypothetical protein
VNPRLVRGIDSNAEILERRSEAHIYVMLALSGKIRSIKIENVMILDAGLWLFARFDIPYGLKQATTH